MAKPTRSTAQAKPCSPPASPARPATATLPRSPSPRQTGNRREKARTLARLGQVSHHQGVYDQAADYSQQALAWYQEIGDRGGEADALNGSGETLLATGRPGQARDRHAEALTLAQQTGDRYQQARAHQGLAAVCHATGQLDQARQHRQHARGILTHLGVPEGNRMPSQPPDFNRGPATSHSDATARSP
jgi:tetratricopeptide (TPR) repeat protein